MIIFYEYWKFRDYCLFGYGGCNWRELFVYFVSVWIISYLQILFLILFNKSTQFLIDLPNLILTDFPIIQKCRYLLPNLDQQIQILDLLLLFIVVHFTQPFPNSVNFSNNSFHASTILHYRASCANPSLNLLLFLKVSNGLL